MRLHNTLSGDVEEFKPIEEGKVGMYHCGPTVYDHAHIGNFRSYIFADILRRTFEYLGYEVKQVMNITDVGIGGDNDEGEDKMIKGLKREGKQVSMESMKELADLYTNEFLRDAEKLNILSPTTLPKASEHVGEQIAFIERLDEKGFVYKTDDGVYFDTTKFEAYGALGGLSKENQSRIGENMSKKNQRDFALWKFNKNLGFPSPWGQGFPGWHIECSAMSEKHLGPHFDIHTGGLDLAPIHHNNEIAQSDSAHGERSVNYWLHNEFLNIAGDKMAKSESNFLTIKSIEEHGYDPLAYRYFLLMAHYRAKVNFSWSALEAAQNAYQKLQKLVGAMPEGGIIDDSYKTTFIQKLENDLNTPQALAVVWTLLKDADVTPENKRTTILDFNRVLGLALI